MRRIPEKYQKCILPTFNLSCLSYAQIDKLNMFSVLFISTSNCWLAWNHIPTISASCICRVLRLMKKYNPFQLFISYFNILQSPFSQTFTFIVVIWCYFDMLYLLKGNKSYPQGEIFPDILKALSRLHWCCFFVGISSEKIKIP